MLPNALLHDGFMIGYDGRSIVTVSQSNVSTDAAVFAHRVDKAYSLLAQFERSKPGSAWGCDGVGFECQRRIGQVAVMKSGVGPRKWAEAIKRLTA